MYSTPSQARRSREGWIANTVIRLQTEGGGRERVITPPLEGVEYILFYCVVMSEYRDGNLEKNYLLFASFS